MYMPPGHAEEGHHDGMICLSEWRRFFDWCEEHGQGEYYLAKAEVAAAQAGKADEASRKEFNASVEAVFHAMDSDNSGELSMPEMERVFGEETHDYWVNMDGKTSCSN